MKKCKLQFWIFIISVILRCGWTPVHAIEPVTTGVLISGALASIFAGYKHLTSRVQESCTSEWIQPDVHKGLAEDFETILYGQHLVERIVLKVLKVHFRRDTRYKPLVLSFHGWSGGGKNFVSKLIARNIYREGIYSRFVHWFIATVHFPHQHLALRYKDDLQNWIKGNVSQCEWSLFVFDEVDKMPSGVLDAIKPFVDYYDNIDGVDYRKSIFIFLSNTGGREITGKMLTLWREGTSREDIKYNDFEELVSRGAFNEKGGLFKADVIEKQLIDYYVPFLPLERKHVISCIKTELREKGINNPSEELLNEIADEMPYFPDDLKLFSKVGCKRVAEKVEFYLD